VLLLFPARTPPQNRIPAALVIEIARGRMEGRGTTMTKVPIERRWTVLVYLAGDNSLDSAAVADLNEMKTVGSTSAVALVAQIDRSGSRGAERYVLRKDTALAEDMVKSLGETNTGDPAVLEAFVTWAIASYPAEHYLLVIWN